MLEHTLHICLGSIFHGLSLLMSYILQLLIIPPFLWFLWSYVSNLCLRWCPYPLAAGFRLQHWGLPWRTEHPFTSCFVMEAWCIIYVVQLVKVVHVILMVRVSVRCLNCFIPSKMHLVFRLYVHYMLYALFRNVKVSLKGGDRKKGEASNSILTVSRCLPSPLTALSRLMNGGAVWHL